MADEGYAAPAMMRPGLPLARRRMLALGGAVLAGVMAPRTPSAAAGPGEAWRAAVNAEFRAALRAALPAMERDARASLAVQRSDWIANAARPLLRPPAPQPQRRLIPGRDGAPDVVVYTVGAGHGSAPKPAVLHMHGGGYILGNAVAGLRDLQELVAALDCVAVSVEYRLAPETRYPGALADNHAALRWLRANAGMLGVDPGRIALKGESAGGGHAAALAIAMRDSGEAPAVLQVLIYPMLDDRTGAGWDPRSPFGHYVWTPAQNQEGWQGLLGDQAAGGVPPAGAVPARVASVAGLPPAFIGVGSIDMFFDEDLAYARRLAESGVPVELAVVPGAFHAFDQVCPAASLTHEFTAQWHAALARVFFKA